MEKKSPIKILVRFNAQYSYEFVPMMVDPNGSTNQIYEQAREAQERRDSRVPDIPEFLFMMSVGGFFLIMRPAKSPTINRRSRMNPLWEFSALRQPFQIS